MKTSGEELDVQPQRILDPRRQYGYPDIFERLYRITLANSKSYC